MPEVLLVCTANRCRSPIAEALLRHEFEYRSLNDWTVSSAGMLPAGEPVVDEVAQVMAADYHLDLSSHRSRRVSDQLIDSVDLILTMERRHVREVVVRDAGSFGCTLTVREFIRRAQAAPPDGSQPLDDWLKSLTVDRKPADLMGRDAADDIVDPINKQLAQFRECAQDLDQLMKAVAELLSKVD